MLDIIQNITDNATNYMELYGPLFGFFIIILESILPWLPLCVFITLNMSAFGYVFGFVISWMATIIGCLMSYFFFRYIGKKVNKLSKKKQDRLKKVITVVRKIDFSKLVLIVALPFSPAFLINIACGMSNISFKKFFSSLLIGKTIIVYFWGFIGTSLIESITDLHNIIEICVLLTIAFVISKLVMKKFNIE